MAENDIPISPLDPLGPNFGKVDLPTMDALGTSPFEGESLKTPSLENYKPVFDRPAQSFYPPSRSMVNQSQNVRRFAVGNAPAQTPAQGKKSTSSDRALGWLNKWNAQNETRNSKPKDNYAKIYSYHDAPSGDAFYKRYAGYGQETFDKIGFNPLRDNEAVYNQNTSGWQDTKRMMTNSFLPLLGRGFVSGPKSLYRMMQGDFGVDTEDAKFYEEAAAIGQSTKGGVSGFLNNTMMNFGYTAGIIGEAVLEEGLGLLLAPETGGASLVAATVNNARKVPAVFRGLKLADRAMDAAKGTRLITPLNSSIKAVSNISTARKFWNATKTGASSGVGRFINPLENTMDALIGIGKNADNLSGLAKVSKTAGGFYRDVRSINMALSEARLEGGMTQNATFDRLYTDYYNENGEAPDDATQRAMMVDAKQAGMETLLWNTALVYGSNKIVLPNIVGPRGGIASFLKSKTDDIINLDKSVGKVIFEKAKDKVVKAGENVKNATSKVLKGEFKFIENTFKERVKSFWKDPFRKSSVGMIGYLKANLTEGIQENMQEAIAQTYENYYVDKFESSALRAHLFNQGVTGAAIKDKFDYFGEAWKENNPFTAKGFETFASGFFMGMFASPMNASIEFASKTYNKNFNKEVYTDYMEKKTNYAKSVVSHLNARFSDPKEFFDSKIFNYATQDKASLIKKYGSRKEALDATDEALVTQLTTAFETGTTGMFKDQIASYKDATDDEFEDAFGLEKGTAPKYRARLDEVIDKIDEIESAYKQINEKYPSPIDPSKYNKGTNEYKQAAIFDAAWTHAKRNAIFMGQSYSQSMKRMSAIADKLLSQKPLKNMASSEMEALFNLSKMKNERDMLQSEIGVERETGSKFDLTGVRGKQEKLDSLNEFIKAYEYYQNYEVFDRESEIQQLKAEGKLKGLKDQNGKELTEEEAEKEARMLLEEKLKVEPKSEKASIKAERNLELAYKRYLKSVAGVKEDTYFEKEADEAFALLLDHYKLGRESSLLAEYINLLNNPREFGEHVERNYEWMKRVYENRSDYYEGLVNQEISNVELNSILNALADRNIYISQEDAIEFQRNPRAFPTEFFDNDRKVVIKEGHPEYEDLRFIFMMAAKAKMKDSQNAAPTNDDLKQALALLEMAKQEEIDLLPKTQVKETLPELDFMGERSIPIQAVFDQLGDDQYVELEYTEEKTLKTQVFYKKDAKLFYDDASGQPVELEDVAVRFTKANRYKFTLKPEADGLREIEQRYADKRIELINKYAGKVQGSSPESLVAKFIPYTSATPVDEMDPELYDLLQSVFNQYLNDNPNIAENYLDLDQLGAQEEFESFVRTNRLAKDAIDRYNKKKLEELATMQTGQVEAPVVEINGELVDFDTLTDKQIRAAVKKLNIEIDTLQAKLDALPEGDRSKDEEERLAKLKFNAALAEKYIAYRASTSKSPKMETVKEKLQPILDKQKDISKDPRINKYIIDDEMYDRVTSAIQKLKKDGYSYKYMTIVLAEFNSTIAKGKSVEDFITALQARLPIGEKGMSKYVYKSLAQSLKSALEKKATDKTTIQIVLDSLKEDLEVEKGEFGNPDRIPEIEADIQELENALKQRTLSIDEARDYTQELIRELTYEEARLAGNWIDEQIRNLFNGKEVVFDEKQISKEAFENIFGQGSYLMKLKNRVDSGELAVYANNIKLYDPASKIAGEIDLLFVDREGKVTIVDIKTGNSDKWKYFNDPASEFSKKEEYIMQQTAYANMFYNLTGIQANIAILPYEVELIGDADINEKGETIGGKIASGKKSTLPTKPGVELIVLDPNTVFGEEEVDGKMVPGKTVQEKVDSIIPRVAMAAPTVNTQADTEADAEATRVKIIELGNILDKLPFDTIRKLGEFLPKSSAAFKEIEDMARAVANNYYTENNPELVKAVDQELANLGQQAPTVESESGDDSQSPYNDLQEKQRAKILTAEEQATRDKNVAAIERRIGILSTRSLSLDRDLGILNDTLKYLEDLLASTAEFAGVEVEGLLNRISDLRNLDQVAAALRKAKSTKRADKIQSTADNIRNQVRKEFSVAQDVLNRVKQLKFEIEQLEAIKKDLNNQINYYNNLKSDPSLRLINKSEINQKIVKIKKKLSTIEKLIAAIKNAISKSFEYLKEYLKIWQKQDNRLSNFKAQTGYQELSRGEIQALINSTDAADRAKLAEYPKLKAQYEALEKSLLESMDNVDFVEEVRQAEQTRLDELQAAVRKYDDQLRYLYELLDPIASDVMFDNKLTDVEQGPSSPQPTESKTAGQINIANRLEEAEKELEEAQMDAENTIATFNIADIETEPTAPTVPQTDLYNELKSIIEATTTFDEFSLAQLRVGKQLANLSPKEVSDLADVIAKHEIVISETPQDIKINKNNIKENDKLITKNAIFINKVEWVKAGVPLWVTGITDDGVFVKKPFDDTAEKLTFDVINENTIKEDNMDNIPEVEPVVTDKDKDLVSKSNNVANTFDNNMIDEIQKEVSDKSIDNLKEALYNLKVCD